MKEYNYNELAAQDIVLYLQKSIRASFNNREFDWEFNTFKDGVVFKLYKDGERIVASQAMLPAKLVVNSVAVNTSKSESSYLNKDYRGANHFENLYFSVIADTKKTGSQIIWGFTPAVKVWKTKLNFELVLDNISEAIITFSKYPSNSYLKKYINNKFVQFSKIVLFSVLRLVESTPKYNLIQNKYIVSHLFPDFLVLKEFQKKMAKKHKLQVYLDLNEQYVNWRIKNNPLLDYKSCFFYKNDSLLGYVLFSIYEGRLSVADLSFLDIELGEYIMSHTINQYRSEINSIYYFGNDDSEYGQKIFDLFKKLKAKVNKSSWANTVIKDISEDLKYKSSFETTGWYINGLWTEGYNV